jgi:hypothetical protein
VYMGWSQTRCFGRTEKPRSMHSVCLEMDSLYSKSAGLSDLVDFIINCFIQNLCITVMESTGSLMPLFYPEHGSHEQLGLFWKFR